MWIRDRVPSLIALSDGSLLSVSIITGIETHI